MGKRGCDSGVACVGSFCAPVARAPCAWKGQGRLQSVCLPSVRVVYFADRGGAHSYRGRPTRSFAVGRLVTVASPFSSSLNKQNDSWPRCSQRPQESLPRGATVGRASLLPSLLPPTPAPAKSNKKRAGLGADRGEALKRKFSGCLVPGGGQETKGERSRAPISTMASLWSLGAAGGGGRVVSKPDCVQVKPVAVWPLQSCLCPLKL